MRPEEKFCTSCGAPVAPAAPATVTPATVTTPPAESPPAAPPQASAPAPERPAAMSLPPVPQAAVPPSPAPTPPPPASRSVPPLYIAAAIVGLIVIVGAVIVFGMPSASLANDPAVGTWLYAQAPLTVWVNLSGNGKGEIVIADARDGFYLDHNLTWEKAGKSEYQLYSENYNLYYFSINDAHTELTPDSTRSKALLTRTTGNKPPTPPLAGTQVGPRFITGDVIETDPFEDYVYSVVLAYYPSSDKYAIDYIFFDDPGYHTPRALNYTHLYTRKFIDQDNLKFAHINLSSIRIT